ncbi:MAG TPA: CDP-diacylglycerol--serine O-phosphatidyltransferase, partial [Gammaproteobacteria bacterium]|nr:CDP-diacylglycerol--serine O-phosphatidyltransferase [Gammaproteobacteria bacterium]
GQAVVLPAYVLTILAGALMVSSIGYYSFKDLNLQGRVPFTAIVFLALVLIVVFLSPQYVLFVGFFLYAFSGMLLALWRLQRRLRRKTA